MAKDKKNDLALVRKPSSAVEKVAPRAKIILSSIVADALLLARNARPLRIIHVEQNKNWLLEAIGVVICRKYENATIKTFADGDLAWQELLREEPDLLITTLVRDRGINGFDMISKLATRKAKFPILVYDMLMDKAGEEHVQQLAEPGLTVSCLYCPFTTEQFYNGLSKLLGHR